MFTSLSPRYTPITPMYVRWGRETSECTDRGTTLQLYVRSIYVSPGQRLVKPCQPHQSVQIAPQKPEAGMEEYLDYYYKHKQTTYGSGGTFQNIVSLLRPNPFDSISQPRSLCIQTRPSASNCESSDATQGSYAWTSAIG